MKISELFEGEPMTRDQIMFALLRAQEDLDSPDESVRVAAELVIRNLPKVGKSYIEYTQPIEN